MDRTVTVQLTPTLEQAKILKATLEQHTACFNAVAREGFTTACSNGVELHKRTYYPLRREYPDLPAQLVCAARVKATEAVKSALTRSAKRHLKHLSGKQFRRRRDHDHVLSNRIVQNATPGSTIVLENLKHIRETSSMGRGKGKRTENKRRLHSWSFAELYRLIEYKAEARAITVTRVDPRHTSQTCSKCGHQARNNRRSQALFLCRNCGFCLNADLNASYNIRDKYLTCLADFGTSLVGGPSVKRPIVSTPRS